MSKEARKKELAEKFPEMNRRFQEIKAEIGEPTHEHLADNPKRKGK